MEKIRKIGKNRGSKNGNWRGGTSEYPDHYLMKKIRLEVLKQANYICKKCGNKANQIHHKDQSKDNHSKENLLSVCHSCNHKMSKDYTSKYKMIYGHTVKELLDMKLFKNYYQIPV